MNLINNTDKKSTPRMAVSPCELYDCGGLSPTPNNYQ